MLSDGPDIIFINEEFFADRVTPLQLDTLLADGWRHFGTHFFRYSLGVYEFDVRRVIPLRIRLSEFSLSKSQRRVLRQNADASVTIGQIEITDETVELFERHKQRFKFGVPESIYDFVSTPMPCESQQVTVRIGESLAAVSYFDVGDESVSAIYAMFDPGLASRSLGIFTMLKEIEFAVDNQMELYYQGYSYEGESFYDYKKRFRGTECFDWCNTWSSFGLEQEQTADGADGTDKGLS